MTDQGKLMSVKMRLKNVAHKYRRPFEAVLQMYLLERLLYRVSVSEYADKFVLKGGMLLFALYQNKARPTQDLDFAARRITNDLQELALIFKEICNINCDDSVEFDKDSVHCEAILGNVDYPGVRVTVTSSLGKARKKLQIDVGFGDARYKEVKLHYPVFFEESLQPELWADCIETVVSEKFDAMLKHSSLNSRMKDFHDIYSFCHNYDFDGKELLAALCLTTSNRKTRLDSSPVVFDAEFYQDAQRVRLWNAFLQRTGLAQLGFDEAGEVIARLLTPLYSAMCEEKGFDAVWDSRTLTWKKRASLLPMNSSHTTA